MLPVSEINGDGCFEKHIFTGNTVMVEDSNCDIVISFFIIIISIILIDHSLITYYLVLYV